MLNDSTHHLNPSLLRRKSPLREVVESTVLLALAVLLFRTFAAEGYLISTGSMAPTLLGYHRRVECPACHFAFTRGAAFDKPDSTMNIAAANLDIPLDAYSATQCPNCSLSEINARKAPRNEGDQLLVQKLAYEFRDPHRWEVVVFKNQQDYDQAYVKRVAGLPGEKLQLRDGDVFVNDQLMRKPYSVQRAARIAVSDYSHQPDDGDPDWQPRWKVDADSTGWEFGEKVLSFRDSHPGSTPKMNWIQYEHWIRTGGNHVSRVALSSWPQDLHIPSDPRFRYEKGELICVGTFSAFEKQKWLTSTDDEAFHRAIKKLYAESHVAPIVDAYGYNSYENRAHSNQHDLMLSLHVSKLNGAGQFEANLTDGADWFRLVILPERREIAVLRSDSSEPIWGGRLSADVLTKPFELDFSLFDQQIVIAINGKPLHAPIEYVPTQKRQSLRRPARIGAFGVNCEMTDLKLYRDVYYTTKGEHPDQVYELADDEFFVLGDNSPVSLDSRVWENPAVPRSSLIGKPFVVHLPSRQKEVHWKGKVEHVRVPDFTRIRYIR